MALKRPSAVLLLPYKLELQPSASWDFPLRARLQLLKTSTYSLLDISINLL